MDIDNDCMCTPDVRSTSTNDSGPARNRQVHVAHECRHRLSVLYFTLAELASTCRPQLCMCAVNMMS